MQLEIKVIVRAVDFDHDRHDSIIEVRGEWETMSDAITDIAHHVDGTRPQIDMVLKQVPPTQGFMGYIR